MATIKFYTRETTGKKPTTIIVRLSDGADFNQRISTRIKVFPDMWDSKRQRAKNIMRAKMGVYELNEKLEALNRHILELYINKEGRAGKDFLANAVEEFHNPGGVKGRPKTLFEYIEYFIERAPSRLNRKTGKPVCYKMQREYQRTFDYLKEFAGKKKLDFVDIDLEFHQDFVKFLKEKNLALNTVGKKIQTLKIFLNTATDSGINNYTKYKSDKFVAPSEETEQIYLTLEELGSIAAVELPTKELDQIRDLFLIGAWTGLRFSDWGKVSDNIKDGRLRIKQQKTGKPVVIRLFDTVLNIIKKYNGSPPRVPTNQHMNRTIKEIARLAGINDEVRSEITRGNLTVTKSHEKWELVSTHTARRSFATNMYNMGAPTRAIMKVTGHKTEEAFKRYIRVTDEEEADKIYEIQQSSLMRAVRA